MIRRSRTRQSTGHALTYKIVSVLLCYPDGRVRNRLADVGAALDTLAEPKQRDLLRSTASWLAAQPPGAAERHHVEVFDLTRRCSPYLTYYRYGDTRQRGMALLALQADVRRLAAGGPPSEQVGLDPVGTAPFAPPELLGAVGERVRP